MDKKVLPQMADEPEHSRSSTKKSKSRKEHNKKDNNPRSTPITPKTPLIAETRHDSEPVMKTVTQPQNLSFTAKWNLFCPYFSAKNSLIFLLSCVGV